MSFHHCYLYKGNILINACGETPGECISKHFSFHFLIGIKYMHGYVVTEMKAQRNSSYDWIHDSFVNELRWTFLQCVWPVMNQCSRSKNCVNMTAGHFHRTNLSIGHFHKNARWFSASVHSDISDFAQADFSCSVFSKKHILLRLQ